MIDFEIIELNIGFRIRCVTRTKVECTHTICQKSSNVLCLALGITAGIACGSIVGSWCGEQTKIGVARDGAHPKIGCRGRGEGQVVSLSNLDIGECLTVEFTVGSSYRHHHTFSQRHREKIGNVGACIVALNSHDITLLIGGIGQFITF